MDTALDQLNLLIMEYEEEDKNPAKEDKKPKALTARALETIRNIAGRSSDYYKKAQDSYYNADRGYVERFAFGDIEAIVIALRDDVERGWLGSIQETIHAEVFSDYLEMAGHLLSKGYKDAAAVIIGSTLEVHIKKLCVKHDIDLVNENGRNVQASTLNENLVKKGAYNLPEKQGVTAILAIRNSAAHGGYDDYEKDQVTTLVENTRGFILRNPA